MRAFVLCLALLACGGGSEAGDTPLSESELRSEIILEAESLNTCDVTSDCEAKPFDCGSLYVNAEGDQARLDELLEQFDARFGGLACDTSCQCGFLTCMDNECVTGADDDCMISPPDEMICL